MCVCVCVCLQWTQHFGGREPEQAEETETEPEQATQGNDVPRLENMK